jgi:hypothetical protein
MGESYGGTGVMGVYAGPATQVYSLVENGLFGKRYINYYADNVSYFTKARQQGQTNTTTSINNFTNSADNYSWMWLGYFLAPSTGTYTFFTSSDDASHLWIGPNALTGYTTANSTVNNGGLHGTQERSGTASLVAGKYYPIRIMFGELGGGDIITVSFSGPSITKTTNGSGYYFGGKRLWEILEKENV